MAMDSLVLDVGQESTTDPATAIAGGARRKARGVEIAATDLWQTVKGGRQVLHGVSFTVNACELVAIVGGSGAGKTTLLEALAGVRPPSGGEVRFDGVDLYANLDSFRSLLGYVPQDDIIHADLPLERTLRYAAALRLPASPVRGRGRRRRRSGPRRPGPFGARGRPGRRAVRRPAQARQHRRRAADEPARLLPGRADFGPRSGELQRAPAATARARRRRLHGRLHHPFGPGPGLLRPRRVPRSRGPPGLRRDGRRGARLLRGRARRGDLRAARHRRDARAVGEAVRGPSRQRRMPSRPRSSRTRRAARRHRVRSRMGGADAPNARDARAQPPDAGDPARLAGAGRGDVRRPVPPRGLRLRQPEPERDHDDRVLGHLRRVLLRTHLRPASDRHRAGDPAARAARRPAARRVPGVEGGRAAAVPALRRGAHARRAARAGPAARREHDDLPHDRRHARASRPPPR